MAARIRLKRRDFTFDLPEELIAQYPLPERGQSRLLLFDPQTEVLADRCFGDLPDQLHAGDLLVFNDTRVIPARLFAHKRTGGRVEIMIERILDERTLLAQLRFSKPPPVDSLIDLDADHALRVLGREGAFFRLQLTGDEPWQEILARFGHMPLPPYIERQDEPLDEARYQTVYARHPGAVAAPTAGLHFDEALLDSLRQQGVREAYVTLHVGAGTFQSVRVDDLSEHRMHSEYLSVSEQVCRLVEETQQRGGRVIAVGTTAVRCLETAAAEGRIRPYQGETRLFILPGYRFRCVDAMITNFHMPESTLLMLVCAFAGRARTLAAYRHAVAHGYRFFSYGDAMLITGAAEGVR